jgi:thioredoxin 1
MAADLAISASDFDEKVLKSDKPVLVDFWATWCGPCRVIAPHLEAISSELGHQITVGKVDVDSNQDLAVKYGIMSIPALLIFKDGQIADRMVGAGSKEDIKAWVEKSL